MSLEWFSLAGKVALVTGAAQGIGRAIAEALAAAGARLVIADCQAEKLARTATALTSQGYEVVSVPADVTHAGQVREVVEGGLAVYGALDILMNNAGGSGNIGLGAPGPAGSTRGGSSSGGVSGFPGGELCLRQHHRSERWAVSVSHLESEARYATAPRSHSDRRHWRCTGA